MIDTDKGSMLRLDVIQHPYGPCPAALEASDASLDAPVDVLANRLRQRLRKVYRAPSESILLFGGIDEVFAGIVERASGPIVGFPPSASAGTIAPSAAGHRMVSMARGPGRDSAFGLDSATDIPADSIAIIDSPSDPLGALLSTTDAVRLARACQVVVIDERYAEFAGFSLLPMSVEFDNIVIARTFENWAGIQDPPCAWVVASSKTAHRLGLQCARNEPEPEAIRAALATLQNLDSVDVTLKLLREERSRLFRFLRKLSFLEPIPSWGPFLSARVNIVSRDQVVSGLASRGIQLHAPAEPGLERIVRIGIRSPSAMKRFREAILDLAPELVC